MRNRITVITAAMLAFMSAATARNSHPYIESTPVDGGFRLAQDGRTATLFVDDEDAGVRRVVGDVQADIARVTGVEPPVVHTKDELDKHTVFIGTLDQSPLIDQWIRQGRLDVSAIYGKWEAFLIEVVSHPAPGVESGLVIVGSDKRGTIFGAYDLSEQIGVSPWYWWADVPVRSRETLYVKPGRYVQGPPAVQYRGIFLNNEAPSLSNWVHRRYDGYNHRFYTKVFELILRLRGNFLWPAMWNNSFYTDDPLNGKLADEYGIVMSTSHHEPMMRAWKEWEWAGRTQSEWDYSKNADVLGAFWEAGLRRACDDEKIITLGMRGDGDEPMSEEANITLLETIVADQRRIIADVVNDDLSSVPQVWSLYKEVQGYYERGMRVPDDVILLWCNDNWGNIRRLPTPEERRRSGGAGMYYHFDYVGGPRSYKWINTNPIAKIWEQMHLAYRYGANRIWIVNAGDLKPMEFPMDFFLTLAWDPEQWPKETIPEFTRQWAARQFGAEYAAAAAELITGYTRFNGRRKPELLDPYFYSPVHYREADTAMRQLEAMTAEAERIYRRIPAAYKDAFFQLVLHPVKATAIVNQLHITAGQNRLYARQGRASTNDLADKVRRLFAADAELTRSYHEEIADGKWHHMMDQTHIGYTFWNQPPENVMPDVIELELSDAAAMGIAVEGDRRAWPDVTETLDLPELNDFEHANYFGVLIKGGGSEDSNITDLPVLPEFSVFSQDKHYIDVFNRGTTPFAFTAVADVDWIQLSQTDGEVDREVRLWVSIDWDTAPTDSASGTITMTGTDHDVVVGVRTFNPAPPTPDALNGFVEAGGYVSIEAEHYTSKIDTDAARWEKIPQYGHTLSAMSIFPVTAASVNPPAHAPCLEYRMYLFDPNTVVVYAVVAPTLNFVPGRGLRCAVSFDGQRPQVLELVGEDFNADNGVWDWEMSVWNNRRILKSTHTLSGTGYHTLRFWMVDPGVVLQKIIVDTGGLKPSYLGPPQSPCGDTRK